MLLCYQCKQEKDESEFYKDKKRKTGYRCYCKECESKRKKEYRESHLEQVREREREYEKKNIDKIRGYKRKYVERHREELYAKKSADHINQNRIKRNCAKKKPVRYRLMKIRSGILGRCNSPKDASYKYYGARGISCLWNSFQEFYDDMVDEYIEHGNEYGFDKKGTQLDRIDNNGHYCKENCRRITAKENNHWNRKKQFYHK